MLISLTNFESDERNRVKFMIELTGARVTSYFSADNNILVTRKYVHFLFTIRIVMLIYIYFYMFTKFLNCGLMVLD